MAAVKNSRGTLGVERVEDRLVLTATVPTVDASFANGTLTLTGDNHGDSVGVWEVVVGHGKSAVHELEIVWALDTRLTSSDKSLTVDKHGNIFVPTADAVTALTINLGTGNNNVLVSKATTLAPATITISDGGSTGSNSVWVNGVSGATSLAVTLGSGNNRLMINGSSLGAVTATLASAAKTSDIVRLTGVNVSGSTAITTGAGNDQVVLGGDSGHPGGTYSGPVTISLGAGNDRAQIHAATFSSTLNIDGVSGKDVASGTARITQANLTVVNATNRIHVL
ncbi:MAG TPA: hypothetical protein VHB77_21560 [Planctomycetaceae bacterium]|nr:hypothetical protein [Planctomycetaceae bacterium]